MEAKDARTNGDQWLTPDELDRLEVARKAGIREVIEWVDANVHWRKDAPYKSTIDPDEWQAQKQEKWGIDADS